MSCRRRQQQQQQKQHQQQLIRYRYQVELLGVGIRIPLGDSSAKETMPRVSVTGLGLFSKFCKYWLWGQTEFRSFLILCKTADCILYISMWQGGIGCGVAFTPMNSPEVHGAHQFTLDRIWFKDVNAMLFFFYNISETFSNGNASMKNEDGSSKCLLLVHY